MVKKEVVDYIEKQLKLGTSLQDIKTSLLDADHNIEEIEEAIAAVKSIPSVKEEPSSKKKLNWIVIGSVLVVVIAVVVVMNLLGGEEVVETGLQEEVELNQESSEQSTAPDEMKQKEHIEVDPACVERCNDDKGCIIECTKNLEYFTEAIEKIDISLCNKMVYEEEKILCSDTVYLKMSMVEDSTVDLCDKISDESKKKSCKQRFK